MIQVRIVVVIAIICYANLGAAQEIKGRTNNKAYPHIVFIMADDLV